MDSKKSPICLSLAGLDPSGGAGIIADIKTFSAFGCFATAVITSVTFQNTTGVFGSVHQTAESVRRQTQPILDDFEISSFKTGMLPTREIIDEVARIIEENDLKNLVVDPVVCSTSGFDLIGDDALKSLIEKLFPLSLVVTPNIPEAERITGLKIANESDIEIAARKIQSFGAQNVLIKGGHLAQTELGLRDADLGNQLPGLKSAKDFLFLKQDLHIFEAEFYQTTATHGTGCTLSAAIAANLALGKTLVEAVSIAKKFVNEAIRTAPNLGMGHSPINQLLAGWPK